MQRQSDGLVPSSAFPLHDAVVRGNLEKVRWLIPSWHTSLANVRLAYDQYNRILFSHQKELVGIQKRIEKNKKLEREIGSTHELLAERDMLFTRESSCKKQVKSIQEGLMQVTDQIEKFYLLERKNDEQVTALFLAVRLGAFEIFKLLAEEGDLSTTDAEGNTLLYEAAEMVMVNVYYLLSRGVTFSTNQQGLTPLDVALEQGHIETAHVLLWRLNPPDMGEVCAIFSYAVCWKKPVPPYLQECMIDFKRRAGHGILGYEGSIRLGMDKLLRKEESKRASRLRGALYLSDYQLADFFVEWFLTHLTLPERIHTLDLSKNLFTGESIGSIASRSIYDLLRKNKFNALKVLNLNDNPGLGGGRPLPLGWCFYSGVQCMAAALAENNSLEELHLARTGLNNYDIKSLAEALKTNTSLRFLDISDNPALTDDIAVELDALAARRVGVSLEIRM